MPEDFVGARPKEPGVRLLSAAFALYASLSLLAGCGADGMEALREAAAQGTPVDRPLPEVTLERVGGDSMRLGDLLGRRLTVINFWATWCEPCEEEMPELAALHGTWSDHGVRVVGVAVRSSDRDAIRDWVDRFGLQFPIVHGRSLNWMSREFGLSPGLPKTVLVDTPSRRIRHVWTGARTAEDLEGGLRRYWREEWGRAPTRRGPAGGRASRESR